MDNVLNYPIITGFIFLVLIVHTAVYVIFKFKNYKYDFLTGLYSRSYFEKKLNKYIKKKVLPLSVICGDINGLREINSIFDYKTGDKIIKDTGNIFKKEFHNYAITCRLTGNSFMIAVPYCNKQKADAVCQIIKNRLKMSNDKIELTMALGVVTVNDEYYYGADILMKSAEEQMSKSKLLESKSLRSSLLYSLIETLDERSHETREHAMRIKNYAVKIAAAMDLTEPYITNLTLLAYLHDIGKIAVPDNILLKPGRLDVYEKSIMNHHCEAGYRISRISIELKPIADSILSHHERWDGTGYPRGLKEEQIPLMARIISLVDSYDAMTNDRSYRKAMDVQKAREEIQKNAGTQFDPYITSVFLRILDAEPEGKTT